MSSAFNAVPYSRLPHGNLEDGEHDDDVADDTPLRHSDERVKLEKQLLRKVDARMSILVFIYILNYIDRNNAAAARLHGFEEDLHLEGQQFNTILSILYVGYILMQIPSNMFLNYIGKPSIYLPACMTVWGLISVLTGTTTNYTGAVITRFLIGFVEAAFFPGALFLLSKWYKRRELGVRTAILSCGNMISQAFGSLLASVILQRMDGVLGQAGWRWLFYIEGSMTVIVAIAAMFILPDFPTTSAGWLTHEECALAQLRMEEDVGVGDQQETEPGKDQPSGLVLALTDWKVWWLAVALLFMVVSLSFNAFFPTLSATMGYSYTVSLLLCSPPWMFSTAVAFWVTRRSDRLGERFWHITFPLLFGILGFLIAGFTMNTAARYLSLFLMAQSYAGFIVFVAWISNSIPRPPSKRAVALAFVNSLSSLGNVVGSYAWLKEWGPSYRMSCLICIAASSIGIVMSWMFRQHLHRLNVEAERREQAAGQPKGFRYLI